MDTCIHIGVDARMIQTLVKRGFSFNELTRMEYGDVLIAYLKEQ